MKTGPLLLNYFASKFIIPLEPCTIGAADSNWRDRGRVKGKKRVDFPPWPLDKCQRCGELEVYIYMWAIRAPTRWLHCRRFAQSDTQVIDCTKPIHMLAEFISRISTLVVGFIVVGLQRLSETNTFGSEFPVCLNV